MKKKYIKIHYKKLFRKKYSLFSLFFFIFFHAIELINSQKSEFFQKSIGKNLRYLNTEVINLQKVENSIPLYGTNLPIAVFHGISDQCNGWMDDWAKYIGKAVGSYSRCVESGANYNSEFQSIQSQAKKACEIINSDENFSKEFNLLGFSQGGLIARYILQYCEMPGKVKRLITIGTPNMGIEKIPCKLKSISFLCSIGEFFGQYMVFLPGINVIYSPLAYFRTPYTEYLYRRFNNFLAKLNNESIDDKDKEKNKKVFSSLEKLILVKFENDDIVFPKESSWFQKYEKNFLIEDLDKSEFYVEDFLGLRNLVENNKVEFISFSGKHMKLNRHEIDMFIVPALI